ncbi:MAG: DUF3221 domain-containing protein [Akkermansiaceae bacterium]|nr:DUF3221 domain-containing protein [Akkermansiaceae bacterium]
MKALTLTLSLTIATVSPIWAEEITPERMAEIERKFMEEGIEHPIIKRQREFSDILNRIAGKHADIFVGAEVGEISKIYLKGETPKEVREWVNASDLMIRIVDKLPFSLKELEEKSNEASALLEKAGYSVQGSSVEAPHDIWIQVGLKNGQPSAEKEILRILPKDLAEMVTIETIGGKHDPPGMVGHVVAVADDGNSFLLTKYEPEKGSLACNSATWFADQACGLRPGQKVEVWFSMMMESYPGQSSAIRTKVVDEDVDGKAAAIRLAIKKRAEDAPPGIPYLVSVERDKAAKQWKVLFASDTNEGKPDAEAIVIKESELIDLKK